MTDFLAWWADHWPLVPFLLLCSPAIILSWMWAIDLIIQRLKRRREP